MPWAYLSRLSLWFPSYAIFNVDRHGIPRSSERLHFVVIGISRLGSGIVSEMRAVCGPGTKTNPSDGSATLRMFGVVLNVRVIAFGGLNRTLAPVCEKTD